MGGVGKTTTMKVLHNSPEIIGLFQMVIWITMSKDGDIRKVQKDILKRLSLEFDDDESVERTSSRIFQGFSNMKYLLLLDDLWQRMDLDIIGIPKPSKENGCKMVITTRSMVVCNKMEIDEAIKVEILSEEEAWNLFRVKVGNVVDLQDIREIATQVVQECQGLPLAIIVIGGSLRNKSDLREWRSAWKELRSNRYEIIDEMEESVFKILKFSYDLLKSNNIKKCFLYCALYPEDYEIRETELIQCWWAEGFIDGALSLDEAYDKGHAIINYLKDVSLLEGDGLHPWLVKMHDVIRDLALIITSSSASLSAKMVREDGNQFLVRTNIGIEVVSNEEDWGQFQRISLMCNKLCSLPKNPTSLLLETLFLQGNPNLSRIPESFFEHMHNLRVLDLSYTAVGELPSSVTNLVSLRGLYLVQCHDLVTLPSQIGNLKKLQVLHLGGSTVGCIGNFRCLPIEIQQLTLLRSLQVSFYGGISSGNRLMVPNGIISRLYLLEDLSIDVETEGHKSPKFGETIAEEVCSLKELTQLQFHFTTLESFEYFLSESCPWKNQNLKSFQFIVHCNSEEQFDPIRSSAEDASVTRYLRLLGGNYTSTVFAEVLQRANGFYLQGHQISQGLLDFGLENLNQLKLCVVVECNMMEIIINGNDIDSSTCAVLPNMEYLEVSTMPTMRAIWEGPMPPGSFSRLACLGISSCEKLRNIFTRGILQQLSNLEELHVNFCNNLQVVVDEEEEGGHDVALFPKLKILTLKHLRRLKGFGKQFLFPWHHP
ncbi:disease resistance protein At4g27190-like [Macadamia integrifolia]|uniref:disease resistance protein At4g27190-like n=1 Tax=Macadamia integrifolia TaxID=60698 RepID=UPI001C4E845C|nr:disease resistance protein At4g27190-like [Macadamia integrifolia]XP_042483648.1 disease resistance protein At4g27190-like [Macadamia integrifolia]